MEELLELIKRYGNRKLSEGMYDQLGYDMEVRQRVRRESEEALDAIQQKVQERIALHNVAMDMYECLMEGLDKIVAIEDNPEHETRSLFYLNSAISIAGNARVKAMYMAADHLKGKDNEKG